jgi:allantoinase
MIDRQQLEAALPAIAESGLPLLVHAELAEPIDAAFASLNAGNADWRIYATYLQSRPDEAELQAIALMIRLCRQYRFRLHIVHLATSLALPILRQARAEGLPLTVETCPHYLRFAAERIPDGATDFKCAPPIRGEANREALWQGLRDGVIDLIATDHSPCPPELKRMREGRFDLAWGGIASLSVALPVVWTEAKARGFTLDDLVRWMAASPARLAGMEDRVGALTPGRDANFVVFDPEATFTVTAEKLHFRHAISPYIGEQLHGVVRATYLRGEPVFAHDTFAATTAGRELTLSYPDR